MATYIAHVEAGVRELSRDKDAILVFSGGATKRDRTQRSEGEGYLVSVVGTQCERSWVRGHN